MEYYLAIKRNKILIHATIQMDPEDMLKERNCHRVPRILYILAQLKKIKGKKPQMGT